MFLIGHVLGMLLLGIALWRSGAVAPWAAALVGVGPIIEFVVHDAPHAVDAGAFALVLIGMAACAASLLRIEDQRWDLPTQPGAAGHLSAALPHNAAAH